MQFKATVNESVRLISNCERVKEVHINGGLEKPCWITIGIWIGRIPIDFYSCLSDWALISVVQRYLWNNYNHTHTHTHTYIYIYTHTHINSRANYRRTKTIAKFFSRSWSRKWTARIFGCRSEDRQRIVLGYVLFLRPVQDIFIAKRWKLRYNQDMIRKFPCV